MNAPPSGIIFPRNLTMKPIDLQRLTSQWKPILVFSNGRWREKKRWSDVSAVDGKEKGLHDWQQIESEVEMLVE